MYITQKNTDNAICWRDGEDTVLGLEAAVRIVPKGQDYSQEIKQLQVRLQKAKEQEPRCRDPVKCLAHAAYCNGPF